MGLLSCRLCSGSDCVSYMSFEAYKERQKLHSMIQLMAAVFLASRRAQEIEPGYCEPTYWIGLTVLNNGDPVAGLASIKASLSCKYTAADALTALNKVYMLLMEAGKGNDPAPMMVSSKHRSCCLMTALLGTPPAGLLSHDLLCTS